MTLETYTTIDGAVLDLTGLTEREQGFLAEVRDACARGAPWADVTNIVTSAGNPVLTPTGGRITRAALDSVLFRAAIDLTDRLGIAQGELAPEGAYEADPFDDEWLGVTEAAERKGVARQTVHLAIQRRDLVSKPGSPGGRHLVVSRASLNRWQPNERRQAAGREIAAARG